MILKEQDDRIADMEALQRLLQHPNADERARRRIETQIRNLKAGDLGEHQAAYFLKVNFGLDPSWIVLNDLRIVHGDLTAQIDHLLVNRLLDVWILESKRFGGGVKINEHGEFITFYEGRPRALPSPIEQAARHRKIFESLIAAGGLALPTRLGFTLKPKVRTLVLVSGGAIRRPKAAIPGLETVIMADQVKVTIDRIGERGNPLDIAKAISADTLAELGQQLLALHRPVVTDWAARIGLEPKTRPANRQAGSAAEPPAKAANHCEGCGAPISKGIVAFCARNWQRFRGQMLCMACQPKHAVGAGSEARPGAAR
jgi:hypothetical protein